MIHEKHHGDETLCRDCFEPELDTLRSKNAMMYEIMETQRVFLQHLYGIGGIEITVRRAIRAEIDSIDQALAAADGGGE